MYVPAVSTEGSKNPVPLVNAGDQTPPVSGVPPRLSNKSAVASGQKSIIPSVPAFGTASIPTMTVAIEFVAQFPVAKTVYVYTPGVSTEGSKNPVPLVNTGDQIPPVSGVPFKLTNKSAAASVKQKSIIPSVPAFGAVVIVTSTVAIASGHPPASSVYV